MCTQLSRLCGIRADQSRHGGKESARRPAGIGQLSDRIVKLGSILFFLAVLTPSNGAGADPEARLRGLNNDLLRLQGELRGTSPSLARPLRAEAGAAIEQRFSALQDLIRQDPRKAVSLAFSPEILAGLAAALSESAASLESHVSWEGPVEYYIADDFVRGTHRAVRRIKLGGEWAELHFAGLEPAGLKSGDIVVMNGVRVGADIAAAEAAISGRATAAASCGTTGVQKTAVLLVTWPGAAIPSSLTPTAVYDTFFGTVGRSLDGYWREASYGKASTSGDVFGWYILDRSYTCAEGSQMRDAAIAMAAAEGANFQNYTRIFVIYPDAGCTAGFAQVGCSSLSTPSGSITASSAYLVADYVSGDQGVQLIAHEAGHNLGLQHAGTLGFGTEALGPVGTAGTVSEFGDYWSTMGSQDLGIYPAAHKAEVLHWMDNGANYQVVESSGTWSLQPLEVSPPGLQALKIRRGTGNDAWLWVEYRQPVGDYDSTLMTQPFSGALIHYQQPSTGAFTHLLDFTPDLSWNTWWYPALEAGQTWVDPYTDLSLMIESATPNALTVRVSYGTPSCVAANPAVSIAPPNPSGYAGETINYTVSVTSNDSADCSSRTFDMDSGLPSAWATAFSPASITLSPGTSGAVIMGKTSPAGATPGTYAVDAKAINGSSIGSGTANYTVSPPACTPSNPAVSISPLNPSGYAGTAIDYTVSVANSDSAGCSSRAFTLSSALPSAWLTAFSPASITLSPGQSGTVTMSKTSPTGVAPGTYTVDAVAAGGSSVGSAMANYIVSPPPCTAANPSVTMSPTDPSAYPGTTVNYIVSVTNNDWANCSPETFVLTSSLPSGWTTAFSEPSVTIAAGQSKTVTLSKTSPENSSPGKYPVDGKAIRGSSVGSGASNYTVLGPPVVTLSVPATVYARRDTVSLTAVVMNNGSPASGAAVTFALTKPDGSKATKKQTANASGIATWVYRLGQRDPAGSYTCIAAAVNNSRSATSNTVTFTVR